MDITNIHDAKTQFSKLIRRVEAGETIVIGRAGHPVAELIPHRSADKPRKGGQWKGLVKIHKNFDAPLPKDITSGFDGTAD